MRIALGIVVVAVVVLVAMLLRPESGASKPAVATPMQQGSLSRGSLAPDAVLAIAPRSKPPAAAPARYTLTPTQREFYGRNYGAMHARLSKGPRTPEESWMLARILEYCAMIPGERPRGQSHPIKSVVDERRAKLDAALAPGDPDRAKRLAAFDAMMRDPCEGLPQLKSTREEIDQLDREAAAAGDPKARLALLRRDIRAQPIERSPDGTTFTPKVSDEQMALIRQSLASNDPTTALEAVMSLAFSFRNASLRDPDGKPVELGVLMNAATLVACDSGYPCGADAQQVATACVYRGHCDALNLRDYLLYYAESPHDSQVLASYENALREAAATGQASFFNFSPEPSPLTAMFQ